jgi:hypothetical protein
MQEWLDTARDLNPSIHWPRLPQKQNQNAEYNWQPITITRKDNE